MKRNLMKQKQKHSTIPLEKDTHTAPDSLESLIVIKYDSNTRPEDFSSLTMSSQSSKSMQSTATLEDVTKNSMANKNQLMTPTLSISSLQTERSKSSKGKVNTDVKVRKISTASKMSEISSRGSKQSQKKETPKSSTKTKVAKAGENRRASRHSSNSMTSVTGSSSSESSQSKIRSSTIFKQKKGLKLTTEPRRRSKLISPPSLISRPVVDKSKKLRQAKKHEPVLEEVHKSPPVDELENLLHSGETSEATLETIIEIDENAEWFAARSKMLEMLTLPDINDLSETSLPPTPKMRSWQPQKLEQQSQQLEQQPEQLEQQPEQLEPQEISETIESGEDIEEAIEESSIESSSSRSTARGSPSSLSLLNLSSLSSIDHELFTIPEPKHDSTFSNIAQRLTAVKVRGSQVEFMHGIEQENLNVIESICLQFLEEVIARTVAKCEEPARKLAQRLDKFKMWKSLRKLVSRYCDERLMRNNLLKWTTEHFLRKKRYVFIRQPKAFDEINHQRFHSAIIEFDRQLDIERKTNEKVRSEIFDLKKQIDERQELCDDRLSYFERIVHETLLQNDSFTHLKSLVNSLLLAMSKVRNEVSDLRLELLYAQHRFAYMIAKSEELEDLGHGLKMREFLIRQADAQVLTLKIEERNSELTRLHTKINFDVHALAHLKNKECMWARTHRRNKDHLQSCILRKTQCRELIYKGKLKHNAISREINRLRFDGGLLHYPVLLNDFDQTLIDLAAKRKSVEKLRNTHKNLLKRINLAERLSESMRRKSIKSSGSSRKSSIGETDLMANQLRISSIR